MKRLVGGLDHEFYFSIYWEILIPTDFHIFQRGRSTTNQKTFDLKLGIACGNRYCSLIAIGLIYKGHSRPNAQNVPSNIHQDDPYFSNIVFLQIIVQVF